MTPERAVRYAEQYEAQMKANTEEYGAIDETISINVIDSVVVILSYGNTDLRSINRLFELEHENRAAMHLISGRYIRPARESREEDSGILAGLDLHV